MKHTLIKYLVFALLLIWLPASNRATAQHPEPLDVDASQPIHLIQSDQNGVLIRANLPTLQRTTLQTADGNFEQIRLDGYGWTAEAGHPELPQKGVFVALPPGAVPQLSIESSQTTQMANIRVAPSKQMQLLPYNDFSYQTVPKFVATYPVDAKVYNAGTPYPATPARLGDISWLRDQRVVQLILTPLQWVSAGNTLTVNEQLTVKISFTYPDGQAELQSPRPESAEFENSLQHNILNYEQAKHWRTERGSTFQPPACGVNNKSFRISVAENGIYAVHHADLVAEGLPANVDATRLKICYNGQEIPIQVDDVNGNDIFDGNDKILFYGEGIKTQETETNIYFLQYGGAVGLRMSQENASPSGGSTPGSHLTTLRLEQDSRYYALFPTADTNDHWYWDMPMDSSGVASNTFIEMAFTVANRTNAGTASVAVELWGFLNDEHHKYEISINGNSLGTNSFYGSGHNTMQLFTANFPNSFLQNGGNNTLRIDALTTNNGSDHLLLLNWAEVTYQQNYIAQNEGLIFVEPNAGNWQFQISNITGSPTNLYDITDSANPIQLTHDHTSGTVSFSRATTDETHYAVFAPTGLHGAISIEKVAFDDLLATNQQADYLIITDPYFDAELAPLIAHRSADYSVRKVYISDIFDQFNAGKYDTQAIRAFVDYAYNSWSAPAPQFLLLAGEGTYDHRNVMGQNGATGNLVPVYLRSGIDIYIGEAASDNQYVNLPEPGNPNGDDLADLYLGRLPATTTTEMNTMINKIISFENAPTANWRANHIFLVDNGYEVQSGGGDCVRDPAADFFFHVNEFVENLFPLNRQNLHRLYYAPTECYPRPPEYPIYETYYAPTTFDVKTRFLNQYNSEGDIFMSYIGHSSVAQYSKDGGILNVGDVSTMNNSDRLSINLPMTCLAGTYHLLNNQPSLEEAMLKHHGGGSVASYVPTGLQVQTSHNFLLEGFYSAIYTDGVDILGGAVMGAKIKLDNDGPAIFQDLQDTFMTLGDPALKLGIFDMVAHNYLPLVVK